MAHIPTHEADDHKVYRIARELGISLENAAVTCDAFALAFSDDRMRRAIFGMIDELDISAAKKGEPMGLIINYTVELGMDGIRVGRYADEIPPGQVVSLTPTDRAAIHLRIKDNFPTQQFLGPIIMNRPDWEFESEDQCPAKSEIQNPESKIDNGVVCSDSEIKEPAILLGPSSLEPARAVIFLGPIRLKFNERFPCVSAAKSSSQRAVLPAGNQAFQSKALMPPHHLPPWAALPAGMPAFQSSGLSPPPVVGECGHSASKDVPPALAIDVRDTCLTFGSLKFDLQAPLLG